MANALAIHSVGNSIVTYLRNSYPQELRDAHTCEFLLVSSGQLAKDEDLSTSVSFYLHRVTVNEHLRNAGTYDHRSELPVPLSIDLHYLLSVWADDALAEQTILGWALRQLYSNPVLDVSSLSPEAEWDGGDLVQLVPSELSNEDLMRIWDALAPSYRISYCYVARVIRLDVPGAVEAGPVVATRHSWQTESL